MPTMNYAGQSITLTTTEAAQLDAILDDFNGSSAADADARVLTTADGTRYLIAPGVPISLATT